MPELPEVEVVRAGLAPAVTGAVVRGVTVLDDRALTRHAGTGAEFETALTGRTIRAAARRGKFLWDWAFAGGSIVAALAQGIALGALVQGIPVEGRHYAGGWWD